MPTGLGDEQLWISATNDNTGTSTAFDDQSGNGNDGVTVGAVTVSADTGDGGTYAFNLAAGSDGITLPADIISGLTEYSYGIWVKLAGGQASSSNILGGYDSSNTETNPTFFVGATDHLRVLGKTDSGSTISYDIENPATSGVWKHLFFTYSAANGLKTYENGVLLNTYTTQPSTGGDGTVPFAIGKSYHNATICLTDDARVYHREITQAEVTHLATSRGIEGGPTFFGVSLRANASYVTDTDNFVVCTPNTATSTNQTDEYNAAQGFGMVAGTYVSANFRDRSTSLASQLAGMTFQSLNSATFRFDLPDGAGEYKVWFAGIDAAAGQTTGWRFKDGTGGTEFATLDSATTTTQYVDINNTQQLASAFDIAGSNYIQRTFTNDHFTIVRDTALASGNGVISAVWVEKVGGAPPTTQYNAFITHAFKQLFQTRLR